MSYNNDHYVFDKRVMKKLFIKYGLFLLAMLPIFILVNILLSKSVSSSAFVFVDIAIGLICLLIMEIVISKVNKSREQKLQNKKKKDNIVLNEKDVVIVENMENQANNNMKFLHFCIFYRFLESNHLW